MGEELSVRELLSNTEALSADPRLADVAARLFEFVQFLLDDEENVTPAGNLTGKARERLAARTKELLATPDVEDSP